MDGHEPWPFDPMKDRTCPHCGGETLIGADRWTLDRTRYEEITCWDCKRVIWRTEGVEVVVY